MLLERLPLYVCIIIISITFAFLRFGLCKLGLYSFNINLIILYINLFCIFYVRNVNNKYNYKDFIKVKNIKHVLLSYIVSNLFLIIFIFCITIILFTFDVN